ncbi:hypothetical protein cyc_01942 [Cyclospora cayetanensis]|uniref:Uncharacterized protein n=1 Tax=Cyclospora cayetanensis TaxID=88456 RepID=A0A1D3CVR2_9EIME|nr:hypothetical protein cyc_01942 [Cyclospora cayetanensis]
MRRLVRDGMGCAGQGRGAERTMRQKSSAGLRRRESALSLLVLGGLSRCHASSFLLRQQQLRLFLLLSAWPMLQKCGNGFQLDGSTLYMSDSFCSCNALKRFPGLLKL